MWEMIDFKLRDLNYNPLLFANIVDIFAQYSSDTACLVEDYSITLLPDMNKYSFRVCLKTALGEPIKIRKTELGFYDV